MLRATRPTFSTARALGRSTSVLMRSRKQNSSSLFSLRSSALNSAPALCQLSKSACLICCRGKGTAFEGV